MLCYVIFMYVLVCHVMRCNAIYDACMCAWLQIHKVMRKMVVSSNFVDILPWVWEKSRAAVCTLIPVSSDESSTAQVVLLALLSGQMPLKAHHKNWKWINKCQWSSQLSRRAMECEVDSHRYSTDCNATCIAIGLIWKLLSSIPVASFNPGTFIEGDQKHWHQTSGGPSMQRETVHMHSSPLSSPWFICQIKRFLGRKWPEQSFQEFSQRNYLKHVETLLLTCIAI